MTSMPTGDEPREPVREPAPDGPDLSARTPPPDQPPDPTQEAMREAEARRRDLARRKLQSRRDLSAHAVVFVVVNAFLVGIWAFTGRGYFWPGWVIGGWGIGLALNAWDVLLRRPVTEADVDAELRRRRD
ncbi:MAG TPA: 2TM domain-containing protein [Actinomycetes bacterium]|nr:2TM domain-containing protein [Actinomycetes bacterium]